LSADFAEKIVATVVGALIASGLMAFGRRLAGPLIVQPFLRWTHNNVHHCGHRSSGAGVDLLTVQKLGGWRTLSMVQRYAHLAPNHLDQRPPGVTVRS
jgi:hypothetical protein